MDEKLGDSDMVSKEIKVPCRINDSYGDNAFIILDGQYLKCINPEDVRLAGPFPINSLTIFEQENIF